MLPIQPRRRRQRDKELTPIRILPTIRHTQDPRPRMLQSRIDLIFELVAVDRSAAATGTGRIAGLEHEIWDYAVEDDVVVVPALGEGGEVVAGLRNNSMSVDVVGGRKWDLRVSHKELRTLGAWLL